jgi:tRNA (guanine37-N1)-methyltransferase
VRFDVVTLFPELFAPFLSLGVTRRAFASGAMEVRLWQLRDFAEGAYRRVDDRPFGGGPGMVLMAEPLSRCVAHIRTDRAEPAPHQAPLWLFSPLGRLIDHALIESLANPGPLSPSAFSNAEPNPHGAPALATQAGGGAILLCGRYEGIDQRFIETQVDGQLSLGDFVMSGGEIAALALLDAVARLRPGVLNDPDSHHQDSFNPALDGLLDSPHYTRPEVWTSPEGEALPVPAPLMSGHHAQIQAWRREQSLRLSARLRPDLIDKARQAGRLSRQDERILAQHLSPKQDLL